MLAAVTVLLVYQLVGEIAVVAFRLPVPGPVVGMALLFRLEAEWLPISVSLVLSTLLTIAVTAIVMRWLLARRHPGQRS